MHVPQPLREDEGDIVGFLPDCTFSGSAVLLETSGKTRVCRMCGLGMLILHTFFFFLNSVCLNTFV